jgi:hypothetical protein
MQAFEYTAERIWQKLASTNETSRGVAPYANASGLAIEQLQEAAQTKIRGKSRFVEMYLKDIGKLMVSRMLQFYTIPRVIRLTNNEGAQQYFKFHVTDQVDEAGEVQKVANYQEYVLDEMGQYQPGPIKEIPIKSSLDVRISTGSQLPFAKAQKAALAEKLFDKKIIDAEEYLTQIDFPNREKILSRMRQMQQMQPMGGPDGTNATGNAAPSGPATTSPGAGAPV